MGNFAKDTIICAVGSNMRSLVMLIANTYLYAEACQQNTVCANSKRANTRVSQSVVNLESLLSCVCKANTRLHLSCSNYLNFCKEKDKEGLQFKEECKKKKISCYMH